MTTVDTSTFAPSTLRAVLGIDRRPRSFGAGWPLGADTGFDLVQTGDGCYRLTVDVAGYDASGLTIDRYPNALVISGEEDGNRSHRSTHTRFHRSFRRVFPLPEAARVTGATVDRGLLSLELKSDSRPVAGPVRVPISQGGAEGALGRIGSRLKSLIRRLTARFT